MQDSLQQSLQHLHNVLDEIDRVKEEESKIIERLPEDMNYHLWFRRWFILTKEVVQKEIDKVTEKIKQIEINKESTE